MTADDRTAKDLLRSGELPEVAVCGWELGMRLYRRQLRRPAGSSARLWRKVGAEDPFAEEEPQAEELVEHRAPAAAARFKQIDLHAKKKEKQKLPAAAQKPQHSRELQAKMRAAEKAARAKQKKKNLVARYGEELATQMMNAASAAPTAPAPTSAKKRRKRPTVTPTPPAPSAAEAGSEAEGAPIDRRPPRVAGPDGRTAGKQRIRVTDRRDEDGVDRRPPRVGLAADKSDPSRPRRAPTHADGSLDRRPPRVGRRTTTPEEDPGRRRPTVSTGAEAIDRRPPRVGLAAEKEAAAEAPLDRTPPRLDRTPPAPGGGSASGMDDLFGGGAQEGRMRRPSPEEEPGRKRVVVTEAPSGGIDRTPPRLAGPPGTEPASADTAPSPAPEPPVDRTPPRLDRSPPKPGGSSGGGMDDLFGGMQEGRLRRPKPAEAGPKKVLVTEAPSDGIDRTPPRIGGPTRAEAAAPEAASTPPAESTPEPPPVDRSPPKLDRSPPKLDRSPPKPGGGGGGSGMDDLFGGMSEGRIRRPKKEESGSKKVLVTEAPSDGVDRTPPRIVDED